MSPAFFTSFSKGGGFFSLCNRRFPRALARYQPPNHTALYQEKEQMAFTWRYCSNGPRGRKELVNAQSADEELTFSKAAQLLFAPAPNPDKFGWDFHLWQFFVACLPPAAVYLLAQYARYDMSVTEKRFEEISKARLEAKEEVASQIVTSKDETPELDASGQRDVHKDQPTTTTHRQVVAPSSIGVLSRQEAPGNPEPVRIAEEELRLVLKRLDKLERQVSKTDELPTDRDAVSNGGGAGRESKTKGNLDVSTEQLPVEQNLGPSDKEGKIEQAHVVGRVSGDRG